jgi:hypothetical protein
MMGGETQQTSLNQGTGYSNKAKRTISQAYLELNSNSMQKPVGGLSVLADFPTNSNSHALNKGGG